MGVTKKKHLQAIVDDEKKHELNASGFIKLVRKYTRINELTPGILREFIDKIVVHHREKVDGVMTQTIEIYYRMIGQVDLPSLTEQQKYLESFGQKKKTA